MPPFKKNLLSSKNDNGNYCILCIDQKNLQNSSIKVWLAFFKDGTIFMNIGNSKTSESH